MNSSTLTGKAANLFSGKEDPFFLFLLFSVCLHIIFVAYIKTVPIPEHRIDEIPPLPRRFAKFIFSPAKKKERLLGKKIEEEIDKIVAQQQEEKQEEKQEKKQEEKPKPKPVEKKEETAPEEKPPSVAQEPTETAGVIESRGLTAVEKIRERVKSRALLGLLTSKKIETKKRSLFRQVDSALQGMAALSQSARKREESLPDPETLSKQIEIGVIEEVTADKFQQPAHEEPAKERVVLAQKEDVNIQKELDGEQEKKIEEQIKQIEVNLRLRKKEDIDKVIKIYMGGLKFLYNKALRQDPNLRGAISIKFTVSPGGRVVHAEVVKSGLKNRRLERSIIKRMLKWKFPAEDVDETTVVYPFIFLPTG